MGYATKRFSKRLKQLRETAGLTQEQFAKELKVSRGAISYYEKEKGLQILSFWTLCMITLIALYQLITFLEIRTTIVKNTKTCLIFTD